MYKKVKLNFLTVPCPARLCLNKPNTIFLGSGLKLVLFVALNHPTTWRVQHNYDLFHISLHEHSLVHSSREHLNPQMTNNQHQSLHQAQLVRASHLHREVMGSNPVEKNCKNCIHNCEDHYSYISIFSYKLLISNHMIFRVQFGINNHE